VSVVQPSSRSDERATNTVKNSEENDEDKSLTFSGASLLCGCARSTTLGETVSTIEHAEAMQSDCVNASMLSQDPQPRLERHLMAC
jgi:hypothetical protein